MKNEGAGPNPIYYDEALLAANHSGALTTDQQGVGEVNYLASDDYLADADDVRAVRAMGQRRMTDAEYRRKVDSLNESQRLAFQNVLNYTTQLDTSTRCMLLSHHLSHLGFSLPAALVLVRVT